MTAPDTRAGMSASQVRAKFTGKSDDDIIARLHERMAQKHRDENAALDRAQKAEITLHAQAAEITALRDGLRVAREALKRAENQIDIHATNAGHGEATVRALIAPVAAARSRIATLLSPTPETESKNGG